MNTIVKIISKRFSRNRQDCTDSISTLVIIEENNIVFSDLPPSYASNLPANKVMLQQQMTVCGNCMGCIEYNMCMQYQKLILFVCSHNFYKYIYGNKHFLFPYLIKF